jgi:hypothetical protein
MGTFPSSSDRATRERIEAIREEARLRFLLQAAIQADSIDGFVRNL